MFAPIRRTDNSLLGTNEINGTPVGRENATPEQVTEWLDQRKEIAPTGKVFRNINSHFLLDWSEIDIPNPAFHRRDLDLCLNMWPEVASPYKFPEFIYELDDLATGPSASGTEITIEPPLYNDELELVNPTVEARILKEGANSQTNEAQFVPTGSFGVRLYTSCDPSRSIPVKAFKAGNIYDADAGTVLKCAPRHWLAEDHQNSVFGKDYTVIDGPIGGSTVGPPPSGIVNQITYSGGAATNYLDAMGINANLEQFDDDFWEWYKWHDGADEYRKQFWNKIQSQYIPRIGEGYGMLLHDVIGLTQGGNNGRAWVDPIYFDQISPTMHHKMFRDVSHCYKVDKCNYSAIPPSGEGGEVYLIEDVGFEKNHYAGIDDGDIYCRYRQSAPADHWQSTKYTGGDWDRYCKYVGVPQRAVEYDGNYKILIRDILNNFRTHGIFYWAGYTGDTIYAEEQSVNRGYKLVATQTLSPSEKQRFVFGQMNFELGVGPYAPDVERDIPEDTILFFYTNSAPSTRPSSEQDSSPEFDLHRESKVFAYLWQMTHEGKKKWLVELKEDYISPAYRISEFEVFEPIKGGENPFIRDKKFTGKNAGGLRWYLTKDDETGLWKVEFPFDINPNGFFNVQGGNIQLTGITDDLAQSFYFNSGLSPVFVDVPSPLSRGSVRPVGLPGEIIQKNSILWKPPTVVKWNHIKEIHDRLLNPTEQAPALDIAMEPILGSSSGDCSYGLDLIYPNLMGLKKKPEPNHILLGEIQSGIIGTGMVSNGDTPFSDIVLLSDMLHSRNMVLPMLGYKLSPQLPNEQAEWFEDTIQDFTTRQLEPHDLTVKRFGFREPGMYCFMSNIYNGKKLDEDVSYTILVPVNEDPFAGKYESEGETPGGRNKIYRIYHPNGMRWWRDNSLLGCGIQYGAEPDNGSGWGEPGAKGVGMSQVGTAVINLFRKNVPLDKEIVACYLRLVPTYAHQIGTYMVRTAGGGRQWIKGNTPFYNMVFDDPLYTQYAQMQGEQENYSNVDYELKLLWNEEHQHDGLYNQFPFNERRAFCKAKKLAEFLCGEFNMEWEGSFENAGPVTKPSGGSDNLWGMFHQYDYEETKRGQFLDNIDVTVKAGTDVLTFKTAQRSKEWYETLMPEFMSGAHSKTNTHGLCSRLDYDEDGNVDSGNDSRGMGFACSSGGWAKDHRMFDITNIVRKAYLNDRFTAKYNAVVDMKLGDIGEAYNLVLTQPIPNTQYIAFGEVPIFDRITEESHTNFYDTVIENGMPYGVAGEVNYAIVNLKQIPPPRKVEGILVIDEGSSVASNRKLRDNSIVRGVKATASGTLEINITPYVTVLGRPKLEKAGEAGGWRILHSYSEPAATEESGSFNLDIDYSFETPIQLREILVLSNLPIYNLEINGWCTEDYLGQVPMTDPPIYETHMFNKIIVERMFNKYEGDYCLAFLKLPVTKVYEVTISPMIASNFAEGLLSLPDGQPAIKLTYKGLFNSSNPPTFQWAVRNEGTPQEQWYITGGEYAYSSSFNAVILPPIDKYKSEVDPIYSDVTNNKKVGSLSKLGATISYVTGRGSKANLKIKASGTGPAYDVDADSIIEVTDNGSTQLGIPVGSYYGEEFLPWSCTNPRELQGGYSHGELPTNANAPLENYFNPRNGQITKAWNSYSQGVIEVFGEPDHIINAGEFQAPDYIEDTDPVTGKPKINNVKFLSGIDSFKVPNGGRLAMNITVQLSTSDGADLYDSEGQYRKKQVAYIPELYVYMRERVPDFFDKSQTTWSLTLG